MRTVGKVFKSEKKGKNGKNGRNGIPEAPLSGVTEQAATDEQEQTLEESVE